MTWTSAPKLLYTLLSTPCQCHAPSLCSRGRLPSHPATTPQPLQPLQPPPASVFYISTTLSCSSATTPHRRHIHIFIHTKCNSTRKKEKNLYNACLPSSSHSRPANAPRRPHPVRTRRSSRRLRLGTSSTHSPTHLRACCSRPRRCHHSVSAPSATPNLPGPRVSSSLLTITFLLSSSLSPPTCQSSSCH